MSNEFKIQKHCINKILNKAKILYKIYDANIARKSIKKKILHRLF